MHFQPSNLQDIAAQQAARNFTFRPTTGQQSHYSSYSMVPLAASSGAATQQAQHQILSHQFASLNSQYPAAAGQYMVAYSMPAALSTGAAAGNSSSVAYASAAHPTALSGHQAATPFPGGYIISPQSGLAMMAPNGAQAGAQYSVSTPAHQDAAALYSAPRASQLRNQAGTALFSQQQAGKVQGASATPPQSLMQHGKHDIPLVVTGEYGLDNLFNGVESGMHAWPGAGSSENSNANLFNGTAAARRMAPSSTMRPPPPATSVQSLMAFGFDPDTLGLALNDDDPLYPTISSLPYDRVERCILPDYHTPEIYRKAKPQVLSMKLYNSFSDATLFYIFYSMPGDVLHIAAARCLYDRHWVYHKRNRAWYHPKESKQGGPGSEAGNTEWEFFDASTWKIVPKTISIDPKDLEKYERIKERMSKAADSKSRRPPPPPPNAAAPNGGETAAS